MIIFRFAFFIGAGLVGLCGCTLFYEPTYTPADGGIPDTGPDVGPDAGPDASPDAGPRTETNCSDNEDNDGDGLIDCNDYDCSYLEACCDDRKADPLVNETWGSGLGNWDHFPVGGDIPIADMGSVSLPGSTTSFLYKACLVSDLGVFGSVNLLPNKDADDCASDYAEFGFTVAPGPRDGAHFRSELRVSVNACGRWDVIRGDTSLTPDGLFLDGQKTVRFSLTPSTSGSTEVMRASISIGDGVDSQIQGEVFIERDEMLDPAECGGIGRGLRLFLEGRGAMNRMNIGRVSVTTAQCANPSQFRPNELGGSAQITANTVNSSAWAAGGLGSPTLSMSGASEWRLHYDATPDPRQIESFQSLQFGIGQALGGGRWDEINGGDPMIGDNQTQVVIPESCLQQDCRDKPSTRDPFVYDGAIAYTVNNGNGPAIAMQPYSRALTKSVEPLLTAEKTSPQGQDAPVCPRGVAHPTFAEVPFEDGSFYRLFFSCFQADRTVIAHQLVRKVGQDFSLQSSIPTVIEISGIYADGGVDNPEIILETGPRPNAIYRLWFIARDANQHRSIGLSQWQVASEDDTSPNFIAFPGNPVLTADATEAQCGPGCTLESLAVARNGNRLQFLLAQSVNVSDVVSYRLVPLAQDWSEPKWP